MAKEYIEREAALKIVKKTSGDYVAAFSEIRALPAADVVEVVHGEWEFISLDGSLWCSRCKRPSGHGRKYENKYCPNCGAKMDGEREEV